MATAYRGRMRQFEEVLSAEEIDLQELRNLCFNGIPDEQGIRSLCWKILLGYLPCERRLWNETLAKKREAYEHFVEETVASPTQGHDDESPRADVTLQDHPLNPKPDSKWQTFFKDNEVLLQIDKDVRRLCPDIAFFQRPTEFPNKNIVTNMDAERLYKRVEYGALKSANVTRKGLGVTKITLLRRKANEEYAPLPRGQEAHWEVVERLLFVYAKLNPGQGYVQGMNEIIGPLYFTFASDPSAESRECAEADCFFCFTNLMSEIRDFFIKTLDDSACGISAMMTRLMAQLQVLDNALWHHLNTLDLRPEYYSFRWLTLLLSQEFPLPDVIRIWDSLFADANRFDFLFDICCAMLISLRSQIMQGDFSSNVKLLQNFPTTDIRDLLRLATQLRSKR